MTIGEFLLQALGFFLQTYPIAVLSFVPFLKKELLFSRKKIYLCIGSSKLFWNPFLRKKDSKVIR